MTAFHILRPGIHTTVQDAGRVGYRALGVPGSGALDPEAMQFVNALVGNSADVPVLEMLYSGMALEVVGGSARVAIGCADGAIEEASRGSRALPAWRSTLLHRGDRLRVASTVETAAAYLAVEGGYAMYRVLGSASTYVHGGFGGQDGRPLRAGDTLRLALTSPDSRDERALQTAPDIAQPATLRVMAGPQTERFDDGALAVLLASEYRVSPASNRTGLRLEGPPLALRDGYDLLSEGVATGSLQVPGSGQPVVLIGDHPTVGGYPKIATIISADWAAAGRLRIGSRVRFALVDESEAAAARRARRDWIAAHVAGIEVIREAAKE